ncbi:MAG: SDR family oxidoreductase [Melioribacteraceae bacterium]|nr:SDR family oxidoreductase [Melioribacteraceae bacterium]
MIIITGAARGIGKFLFEKCKSIDDAVYGTYYSTSPSDSDQKFLSKVDISNYSEVSEWINKIRGDNLKLTLINCVGKSYNAFAHKADIEKWSEVINLNLIGTFNVINKVLPIMRENGYGRIINFSSVVAQTLVPGTSAYAASKAALWGLSRSIAAENSQKGISINNLNLGYHNIGMIEKVPAEFQKIIKSKIPSGEFGNPENIFNAVKFLIQTDYVNGTSIDINGGLH